MTFNQNFPLEKKYVRDFVRAGKSLFTLYNQESGNHITYKVTRAKGENENRPWFVSVLTGPDNTSSYSYIGCIFPNSLFCWTHKSRLAERDQKVRTFTWFYNHCLAGERELPDNVQVFHHGRCCRCNRVLTTPISITTGIGPICAANF